MTIYALFFCMQLQATQPEQCRFQQMGVQTPNGMELSAFYPSLEECRKAAGSLGHYKSKDGKRFLIEPRMWYECDSKHVETWQN